MPPTLEQIKSRCDLTRQDCWLCRRNTVRVNGKRTNLRHYIWSIVFDIPCPPFVVATCRNKFCVNPAHLAGAATQADCNQHCGSCRRKEFLSKTTLDYIDSKRAAGMTVKAIAAELEKRGVRVSCSFIYQRCHRLKLKRPPKYSAELVASVKLQIREEYPRKAILRNIKDEFGVELNLTKLYHIMTQHKLLKWVR